MQSQKDCFASLAMTFYVSNKKAGAGPAFSIHRGLVYSALICAFMRLLWRAALLWLMRPWVAALSSTGTTFL